MSRFPLESSTKEIRLDRNECIVPSIINSLLNLAKIDNIDYTQYTSSLSLVRKLQSIFDCSQTNLYVDNGSEQVIKALVQTIDCNKWVTTSPTFEMFPFYVRYFNKDLKTINFTYDSEFKVDLKSNLTDSGLYLVSPHNPTGFTVTHADLLNLCSCYKYVILDQAYITPTDALKLVDLPNNLIIVRTFSKMGGLTGMRLGFCVSRDEGVILALNELRPMYLNTITLKLVDTLLENKNLLEEISIEFSKVRELINLPIVSYAGNFVLLKNTPTFKNYPLKKYIIDKKEFYRLTLFDAATFYKL
jgi:histidinol-phosphate/aromatic aminotransferase/cobyric acid decarboxylase-like protein